MQAESCPSPNVLFSTLVSLPSHGPASACITAETAGSLSLEEASVSWESCVIKKEYQDR